MSESERAPGSSGPSVNHELLTICDEFLREFYRDDIGTLANKYPTEQSSLVIDWDDIYRFDTDLAFDVAENPDDLREHFEEAVGQFDLPVDIDLSGVRVRFRNLVDEREMIVGEYPTRYLGQLVAVSGQIRQISQSTPQIQVGVYECQRCGTTMSIPQSGGEEQEPYECDGCERQGPFRLKIGKSEFEQHQLVRLELPPEHAQGADSYLDAHLLGDDMAGELNGDERVTVTGELTVLRDQADGRDYPWQFEADYVRVDEGGYGSIDYTKYEDDIQYIANKDDPVLYLADNLAPHIYRDEDLEVISEALVCQIVGAAEKETSSGITYRSDSHGFLVGDPGGAKSEMLEAAHTLAPRSRYASGESVSGAGLTAAAERTDFGPGEWTVKAGLLPKTNNGTVCIDELDKIPDSDKRKMHSALERQQIDFSKAGQNAHLKAKTTLLAAGNPKRGRFDQYEPISEQIDLSPTLVSRFDLIFTVIDNPEEDFDRNVAEKVVEGWDAAARDDEDASVDRDLPVESYQAYFAYARENIEPSFTQAAKDRIMQEYVDIRSQAHGDEDTAVPLTARKLPALLRLSEAVARTRLSETVSVEDAERAINYIRKSLEDVGIDPETGEFDADVVEAGQSKSQRDRIRGLVAIVADLSEEYDEGAPEEEILEYALDMFDVDEKTVENDVQKLLDKGEIYESSSDHYRTTD